MSHMKLPLSLLDGDGSGREGDAGFGELSEEPGKVELDDSDPPCRAGRRDVFWR
jgi:hypothetical protein